MSNKDVQRHIPKAMDAIEKVGIAKGNRIEKVHEGYINSLGANIIQSGLLPTLIFYNKEKRELWLKALYYMWCESEPQDLSNPTAIIREIIGKKGGKLSEIKLNPSDERKILEYAVALKLAARTFVFVEPDKSKEGGE
ncbi:CRISPR-associated protein Cmr5 [Porphyromonas loveana]|uniref:CRISPR type III-B/RAMP module-associated protein Cmr5 n=5 Tax=Porphyromonas loveana TaxID=1884669 RepID=A0A2U1FKP5_9PORP|nr:CRISPR-associated protein Cmr5 [Porphyromonas loveana]